MPDTVRQQIVAAVKTRFEGILTASGYLTDLGERVFLCRPTPPADNELPALNIWDTGENTGPEMSGIHRHELDVEVLIMCGDSKGSTLAEYIRKAVSDLHKAIGLAFADSRKWGELAIDTRPGRNEYELDHETKKLTGTVRYQFKVIYRTPSWDAMTVA